MIDFDYDLIKKDYLITDEDDDEMYRLKEVISSLTPVERKIFLTYCELGTYSATARMFKVSGPTIKSYLNDIKIKILTDYAKTNL